MLNNDQFSPNINQNIQQELQLPQQIPQLQQNLINNPTHYVYKNVQQDRVDQVPSQIYQQQTLQPFFEQGFPYNYYENNDYSNFPPHIDSLNNYNETSQQEGNNYFQYENQPQEEEHVQGYQNLQHDQRHSRIDYKNYPQHQSRIDHKTHRGVQFQNHQQQEENYQQQKNQHLQQQQENYLLQKQQNYQQQPNDYFHQSNAFQQNTPRWADRIDEDIDYGNVYITSGPPCFTNINETEESRYLQNQQTYLQQRQNKSENPREYHR